jgi:putative FmdB family regulatory protein
LPTYEYRCDKNGHDFEVIQGFTDPPEANCPVCGSASERRISMPAIHFKGSGWYRKDNASSGGRSAGAAGSKDSDDGKSDSKSSSASDSKSDSGSSGTDKSSASEKSSSETKTHTHGGSTHSH